MGAVERIVLAEIPLVFDGRADSVQEIPIGPVASATTVDAVVMASAASRGDVVLTADVRDLARLARHFPAVRVLQV